ncbi:DNA-packaging protein [Escherichia coli]|nr:DNA-packaging protein [Escherichia coli]TFX58852.1 DNA-packaging protein [Escherichia coli]TFY01422.1 DNA-packaging protein [Escherichia coli]
MRWWKKLDFVATDNHYHFLRVLSGDPGRYGAANPRIFTIYENFPGSMSGFSAS